MKKSIFPLVLNKRELTINTPARYREITHAARMLKPALEGDLRFEDPEINRIALEQRIIGWIVAQNWFRSFAIELKRRHPRDTPEEHAADLAIQIVDDITHLDPIFHPLKKGGRSVRS